MTTPIVDAAGNVNQTALMLGLRTDGEKTIRALIDAGVHPRDVGIADTTKYGVRLINDPTENPFFYGPDGGNMTRQMTAIHADRAKAIADMKAVDRSPAEWGLTDNTGA